MFHGMGKLDAEKFLFMCEGIWLVKRITDELSKISHMETTFRERTVMSYMKYKEILLVGKRRSLIEIKREIITSYRILSDHLNTLWRLKRSRKSRERLDGTMTNDSISY
jgi:hypothetical protein